MRKFRHPALALFVLAILSPTAALGQAEKVGVVTTLEGNVTARRAVLPLPVPLKFKDDVFFRDTITTGDQSLARVLLGGKSIVTIRERSVVTITESPGRSFISLESGKIGLAVAHERMAPGESVDVRTPNAVVGVRGTVIVAEVLPAAAAVVSNVYFLRGFGECFVIDQQTGRPIGAPVTLKPLEAFKVVGSTARIDPIPATQISQITAGLEGKGIQHKEAANQEQVKTQVAQATAAVLGVLTGGPGGQAAVAVTVPQVASQPSNPNQITSLVVPTQNCATETCGVSTSAAASAPVAAPASAPAPSAVPSNITIDPALAPFAAALAAVPIPVVMIPAGVAPLTIPARGFQVETTTQVPANLDRPLFQATDANLTIGGNLLNVLGSLSSTSSLPVLSTDPTTITTGGDFIRIVSGGSVSINSSLVSDTGGTLTAGGSLISVEGGGSLTSTGASPVVQLNNTNVNVAGPLMKISGGSLLNASLIKASGGMLTASTLGSFGRSTVGAPPIWEPNFGPQVLGCDDCTTNIALGFSFPFRGRTFTSAELSSNAFLSLGGSNGQGCCNPFLRGFNSGFLDGAARISVLWDDPDPRFGNGVRFNTFAGRAVVTWDHVPEFFGRGNNTYQIQLLSDGRVIFGYMSASQVTHSVLVGVTPGGGVSDPGSVNFSSAIPFSTGAVGTVYELFSPNTFDLTGTNLVFTPDGLGGWLVSNFLANGFITIADGAVVTQSGTTPLVELVGAPVTVTGGSFFALSTGSHLTLGGKLLSAIDSPLTVSGGLLQMTGGSQLTSPSATSLVSISGGTHSIATAADTAMLDVDGSTLSFTGSGPLVDVLGGASITGGPFLRANAATLALGSGPLLNIAGGSRVTTSGPVLDLMNTTLDLGTAGTIVNMSGASHLTTTAGPVVRISGGSLTADVLARTDGAGNTLNITGPVLDLTNTTVTLRRLAEEPAASTDTVNLTLPLDALGHASPFIRMANSTLTLTEVGAALVELGNNNALTLPTIPGVGIITAGTSTNPSTFNLKGTLVNLRAGNFTATEPLVKLDHTMVNQTVTDDPLIHVDFNSKSGTTTGQLLTAASSTLNATGPFFEFANGTLTSAAMSSPFISLASTGMTVPNADVLRLASGANLSLAGGLFKATGQTINSVNPNLNTVRATAVVPTPAGVAFTPNGSRAYVTNGGSDTIGGAGTVSMVDTATNTVTGTVAVGTSPRALAITADGAKVYVANTVSNNVSVINTATNTVISTVTVGTSPLAITASGAKVYVANAGSNTVSVIDTTTNAVSATIGVGAGPDGVAITPNGFRAYVANAGSNTVSVIDTTTNSVVKTITVGTTPGGIAITPDGSRAYVANTGSGSVSMIDTATNTVVIAIPVGAGNRPLNVAITPDGNRAYVTQGGETVVVLNISNNTVVRSVTVGSSPQGLAIAPDGGRAFVANTGSSSLSVVDSDAGGRFLNVASGAAFTSTSSGPVVRFDGGTVSAGKNFAGISGTLQLQSPLIDAANATLSSGFTFLTVFAGGALIDTASVPSPSALLTFTGGTLTSTAGNILSVSGNGFPAGTAAMTLARPLFSSSGTTVDAFFHFFRIADGGSVTSTATVPFIQFAGGSFTGGTAGTAGTGSGGSLLRMSSLAGQNPNSFTLANGFLSASGGATLNSPSGNFIDIRDGATLTSTGSAPFLDFNNAVATAAAIFAAFGTGSGANGATGTNVAPSVSFAGSFMRAADTGTALTFSSGNGRPFVSIFDGATVTDTGTDGFLNLIGTSSGKIVVNAASNVVFLGTTTAGAPRSSLTLSGPLLSATNVTLTSGNPASNAFSNVFVGDGAQLTTQGASSLMSFNTSTVTTAGNVLTVRRSPSVSIPTTVNLSGSLLTDRGSTFNTTSSGGGNACCSGFFIGQGAQLSGSAAAALIQLSGSTFISQDNVRSGGDFFGIFDACCNLAAPNSGELIAAARLSLTNTGGSLLNVTDGSLKTLTSLLDVQRSSVTSSGTGPLILFGGATGPSVTLGGFNPFSNATATGRLLTLIDSSSSGVAAPSPASVSLAGPLLVSNKANIIATGSLVAVLNGATLSSTTVSPFLSLTDTTVTTGTPSIFGPLVQVAGVGGTSATTVATMSLAGPLLSVTNGVLNIGGPLLSVGSATPADSGVVTTNGSTASLISFTGTPAGASHRIAGAMFDLAGIATTTVDPDPDAPTPTLLGTDRPLRQGGALFEGTSTSLSTTQVVKLDTALLEATAPIIKLLNSTLTSSADALNLSQRAKLSATLVPGDALVKLNASTLNINSGSLVNVAGGSFVNLRGNLVSLDNNSILNILAGSLFSVSGGSVFKLTGGSLGVFGSTGTNTINITNTAPLCSGCSIVTSIVNFNFPVLLKNSASASNVNVSSGFTPFAGLSPSNKVNISGASGALFVLDGATSKVRLGP